MNNVNKTLYIPLYGKSYVSKKGLFLNDKKAEEIWEAEGFLLKGKSKSKWLAFYMGIRSAVFDGWLTEQMSALPSAVVLHLGCGMDSRILRVGANCRAWYDVDFPEVIEERKRYYSEFDGYRMIAGDLRTGDFLAQVDGEDTAIVVMEGVSMYLTTEQLLALMARLGERFQRVVLLMDCYTTLAAKWSKVRNPVNEVGVTEVYGLDDPLQVEGGGLVFTAEGEMTPQSYVEQLKGAEKFVFRKLYAGSLSKKLYRLYAYEKQ